MTSMCVPAAVANEMAGRNYDLSSISATMILYVFELVISVYVTIISSEYQIFGPSQSLL